MEAENPNKNPQFFYCDNCDYNTYSKKDYLKHLSTRKHSLSADGSIGSKNGSTWKPKKSSDLLGKDFSCFSCNKKYMSRGSLWKHAQKCIKTEQPSVTIIEDNLKLIDESSATATPEFNKDMVWELIKQNKELQNVLIEQNTSIMEQNNKLIEMSKQPTLIQNTTNHTTNNTQFNLNMFLNEQCKDALNIIDFVNSLQVQIKDLEKTGKLGYVEGITSIFLKGLRELDVYMRPIHCTDLKRETVYVKDQNTWEKDNTEKAKLKSAIKQIARKNLTTIPAWQEENPKCRTSDTKENEDFVKIALNSLGGHTEEEDERYTEKIIRNVLKDVIIDKK